MVITTPLAFAGVEPSSRMVLPVIIALYFILFWYFKSATIGMMITHIKLWPSDGGKLTLLGLTLRYFGLILSCLLLGLGGLWMFISNKRQTLQDKLARTLVIRA